LRQCNRILGRLVPRRDERAELQLVPVVGHRGSFLPLL
jgi:hypothetical protein